MKLILGSNSLRRVELLQKMGFQFEQRVANLDEKIDGSIHLAQIPEAIALQKFKVLQGQLLEDELLICADTLVFIDGQILGKPNSLEDARRMLATLSGKMHTVITGVCIGTSTCSSTFSEKTNIQFSELSSQEIDHYLNAYKHFDRAGSYGIQDWIGLIGIRSISGCYTNVMGLPTHRVYMELRKYFQ